MRSEHFGVFSLPPRGGSERQRGTQLLCSSDAPAWLGRVPWFVWTPSWWWWVAASLAVWRRALATYTPLPSGIPSPLKLSSGRWTQFYKKHSLISRNGPPSSIIMTPNSWSHTHASLQVPSALHTWLSQAAFSSRGSRLTSQRARGQGSSGPACLPVLLWVSAPQSTPSALQCSTPLSPPSGVTAPCLLPSVPMSLVAAQPLIFEVLWLRSVRGLFPRSSLAAFSPWSHRWALPKYPPHLHNLALSILLTTSLSSLLLSPAAAHPHQDLWALWLSHHHHHFLPQLISPLPHWPPHDPVLTLWYISGVSFGEKGTLLCSLLDPLLLGRFLADGGRQLPQMNEWIGQWKDGWPEMFKTDVETLTGVFEFKEWL